MEKTLKHKVLNNIGIVYEKSKSFKLSIKLLADVDSELKFLMEYFRCNEIQAVLLSYIFVESYKDAYVRNSELIDYFECNPMELLMHNDDIEYLITKGLVKKSTARGRRYGRSAAKDETFLMNEKIMKLILNNEEIPENTNSPLENVFELLEMIHNLSEEHYAEEISSNNLKRETRTILNNNKQFVFVEKLLSYKLNDEDVFVFLYLIWESIANNKNAEISTLAEYVYDSGAKRLNYSQAFFNKENRLLKLELVEIAEAAYLNDAEVNLSEKAHDFLEETGIKLFAKKHRKDNIIEPSKIKSKKLIYNNKEANEVKVLANFMKDSEFKRLRDRLDSKNLPKGITALFYGTPGTGKTETVYQLAKESGREIVYVDISSAKSMWFGQSEKIIRKIFNDYKLYAKQSDKMPILVFNEADAIISKRKNIETSNVAQTENTMQNIILEELEKFDGIFIATTNLVSNIDKAFERRFLFKLKFCQPDTNVRAKIWKLKMPNLSIKECKLIAEQFDFSGGEIDNIVRKTEMHEIMNSERIDLEKIIEFCKDEKWENSVSRKRIGF
jgi:SpoVK/Ycf46/Vps4 family AAA+-type ATPase